jgi:hypothetical protein
MTVKLVEKLQGAYEVAERLIKKNRLICPKCREVKKITSKGVAKEGVTHQFMCKEGNHTFTLNALKGQLQEHALTHAEIESVDSLKKVLGASNPPPVGARPKMTDGKVAKMDIVDEPIPDDHVAIADEIFVDADSHDDIVSKVPNQGPESIDDLKKEIAALRAQVSALTETVNSLAFKLRDDSPKLIQERSPRKTYASVVVLRPPKSPQSQITPKKPIPTDVAAMFPVDVTKRRLTADDRLTRLFNRDSPKLRFMVTRFIVAARSPIKAIRRDLEKAKCPKYVISDISFIGSRLMAITVDHEYSDNIGKFFSDRHITVFPEGTSILDPILRPYVTGNQEEELIQSTIDRHMRSKTCPHLVKRNALLEAIGNDLLQILEGANNANVVYHYVRQLATKSIREHGDRDLIAIFQRSSRTFDDAQCADAFTAYSNKVACEKQRIVDMLAQRQASLENSTPSK